MVDNSCKEHKESDHISTTDNVEDKSNKIKNKTEDVDDTTSHKNINVFLIICITGVSLAILLEIINVQNRNQKVCMDYTKPKYWVYHRSNRVENKDGILKHIHLVLERGGYEITSNSTPWDLLWAHDYPYRTLGDSLQNLKPHQKVNHFPGIGYITTKVILATTNSKNIPKAFQLPKQKDQFLKYAEMNRNALFLEKLNQHRGVFMKNVSEINLNSTDKFVQEYVQNPFLVDGHKFDIGVYVVMTSVNPLRVYWYKGDVLFRYCKAKYYPLDRNNLDKYVIRDDYLPTWEVPSLAHPYTALGYSMKNSFDSYARSKGKDPAKMWVDIESTIAEVVLNNEHHLITALKKYPSNDNFFEMVRFDFIVDEDLNVYLLEANMSPNLSSAHYPQNQLLYEQVIYNLLTITGITNQGKGNNENSHETAAQDMVSAQKNIAVWADKCTTLCQDDCTSDFVCGLCRPCLDPALRKRLLKAHTEFLHTGDFKRLLPPPMEQGFVWEPKSMNITENNKLQYLWYQGKCNEDIKWCT